MSARDEKFDPNRPDSTPPTRGRTEDEVEDEERDPSSSESGAGDENTGEGLSRTAEIDRKADEKSRARRTQGRSDDES